MIVFVDDSMKRIREVFDELNITCPKPFRAFNSTVYIGYVNVSDPNITNFSNWNHYIKLHKR